MAFRRSLGRVTPGNLPYAVLVGTGIPLVHLHTRAALTKLREAAVPDGVVSDAEIRRIQNARK